MSRLKKLREKQESAAPRDKTLLEACSKPAARAPVVVYKRKRKVAIA
jgi:hypothetical protein